MSLTSRGSFAYKVGDTVQELLESLPLLYLACAMGGPQRQVQGILHNAYKGDIDYTRSQLPGGTTPQAVWRPREGDP